ncbi:auxin-responsive protein IAA32-like [Telopea speciosissima]|uniref:auxin-responsive protein IAA32-like n=1 Tax=Telopea speciosissima TaxID=54955 RepID=UPI001CC7E8CD|nr:auxin-responsive protein IAA32-like [Telopea speciosissima]
MDFNTEVPESFPITSSHLSFVYHQTKEKDTIVDLDLSLRTQQPESHNPPECCMLPFPFSPMDYVNMMSWSELSSYARIMNLECPMMAPEVCNYETEGVQSKERWAYVKVNMEGVVVGRKVCMLDHCSYSSLALQLEDMFGGHCVSGLQFFQAESEFSLLYKDINENWRTVGDVPWKDFLDCVRRLRIARKDEAIFPFSASLLS